MYTGIPNPIFLFCFFLDIMDVSVPYSYMDHIIRKDWDRDHT